jgi:hypothetical protein
MSGVPAPVARGGGVIMAGLLEAGHKCIVGGICVRYFGWEES